MSMPFDATLKDLAAGSPADFLALFDRPPSLPVKPITVDLSTVTAASDFAVGLGDPPREVVCIAFQSSNDVNKGRDVMAYHVLLHRHYKVPVHSVLVLLLAMAAHSEVDGSIAYAPRPGRGMMSFAYEVVRLWEHPAEDLLRGPLGTLPLAVLGALPEGIELATALRGVALRIAERLAREALPPGQTMRLLTSAFVLTGLRVKRDAVREVFSGVAAMRDSDSYMGILDEGREEGVKLCIIDLASKRLGPEDEATRLRLQAIEDFERLRRIFRRADAAPSWQDLLDTP